MVSCTDVRERAERAVEYRVCRPGENPLVRVMSDGPQRHQSRSGWIIPCTRLRGPESKEQTFYLNLRVFTNPITRGTSTPLGVA